MKCINNIIVIILLLGSCAIATTMLSFGGGELSPLLKYRLDVDKRSMGVAKLENMLIAPQGVVFRRPGTYYIAEANEPVCRLIKFEASSEDSYIIELGDAYMRFYRDGGQILSGADPYEIDTVFDSSEIWDVQYAQSDNVMYLVDGNDPVQQLTRTAHNNWTIADADFEKGPFNPDNPPSTYGTDQCSGGTPSVDVATGGSAANLFDNSLLGGPVPGAGSYWYKAAVSGWCKYDFGVGVTKTIEKYTMASGEYENEDMPAAWAFQGSNNDADWTTLDTQSAETDWGTQERRTYTFINTTAYRYYRVNISSSNSTVIVLFEVEMMEDDVQAINITPNGISGSITLTASSSLFDSGHIGSIWEITHTIGGVDYTGIVEITSYASATSVGATVITALGGTTATEQWAEGAWSDYRGWPKTVAFHQQRLVFGGSESYPQTLWFGGVDIDTYLNFEEGTEDANAFNVDLTGQNPIQWMLSQDLLIIGTLGSIGKYGESGKAVTPSSPYYREQSAHGSSSIPALLASDTILYVERGGRRIREFSYDLQYDKFISPDLTLLAPEVTEPNIIDTAFQLRPNPILWCVLNDGNMATLTFQRDQTVFGWSRQITDGKFKSVQVIPGTGEDEVWSAVKRYIGNNIKLLLHFNEVDTTTSTVDEMNRHSPITFYGTAQIDTGAYKFTTGSLQVDGDSDYIKLPDHSDWDIIDANNETWTVDFWVKHADHAGLECYIAQYEDADNYWAITHLHHAALGGLSFVVHSGGSDILVTTYNNSSQIADTNWHHIALCIVSGELGIYLDGIQYVYDTISSSTEVDSFAGPLYIGSLYTTASRYFEGRIDEVRIANSNIYGAAPVSGLSDTITIPADINDYENVYIEQFQPQDWGTNPKDMFFVDSGLSYNGDSTDDLTGLDHLEGRSIYVFADGSYYENVTVGDPNSGDVALSQTVQVAHAGLGYTSKVITFPFDAAESVGYRKRLSQIWVAFYRMLVDDEGCEYGYSHGSLYPVDFTKYSQYFEDQDGLFTGYRRLSMPAKYDDYDELDVYFKQTLPFPMAIQALRAKVEVTED